MSLSELLMYEPKYLKSSVLLSCLPHKVEITVSCSQLSAIYSVIVSFTCKPTSLHHFSTLCSKVWAAWGVSDNKVMSSTKSKSLTISFGYLLLLNLFNVNPSSLSLLKRAFRMQKSTQMMKSNGARISPWRIPEKISNSSELPSSVTTFALVFFYIIAVFMTTFLGIP